MKDLTLILPGCTLVRPNVYFVSDCWKEKDLKVLRRWAKDNGAEVYNVKGSDYVVTTHP